MLDLDPVRLDQHVNTLRHGGLITTGPGSGDLVETVVQALVIDSLSYEHYEVVDSADASPGDLDEDMQHLLATTEHRRDQAGPGWEATPLAPRILWILRYPERTGGRARFLASRACRLLHRQSGIHLLVITAGTHALIQAAGPAGVSLAAEAGALGRLDL